MGRKKTEAQLVYARAYYERRLKKRWLYSAHHGLVMWMSPLAHEWEEQHPGEGPYDDRPRSQLTSRHYSWHNPR